MFAVKKDVLRALVLASIALGAVIACNNVADDPTHSDSVIQVVSASPVSSDPTATTVSDTTTMVLQTQPRNPGATTFFNDVTLTKYTVSFSALLPAFSGLVGSGFVPAGGSATLTLVAVALPASDAVEELLAVLRVSRGSLGAQGRSRHEEDQQPHVDS